MAISNSLWLLDNIRSKATDQAGPDQWTQQLSRYDDYLSYWTGDIWTTKAENIQVESGDVPLRWPIKFNLIKLMAITQAMCTWGHWDEEILTFQATHRDPTKIVSPGQRTQDESAKAWGLDLSNQINRSWEENVRETLLIEQGLVNQVYGGCVFSVTHDRDREYGVRIKGLSPYYFKPVWDPLDYHRLLKAEIIFKLSKEQAEEAYGSKYARSNQVLYRETWTEKTHEITIDGEPLVVGGVSFAEYEHHYGMIPIVYIPRLRMEEFYGLSICEDLMGLQDELNDRLADVGDQILNECHAAMTLVNFTGNVEALKPTASGILNLGVGSPTRGDPKLERIQPGDIPTGVFEHIKVVLDFAKMSAFTPPVAFGQDEGSQRSGVTLVLRMWPLLQQSRWARAWWDEGFRKISKIMLRVWKEHNEELYRSEYEQFRITPQWSPVQPKDREALVNELAILAAHNLQSLKTMVSRLENAQDVEEEIELIKEGLKALLSVKDAPVAGTNTEG